MRTARPIWFALAASLAGCGSPASTSESFDLVVAGGESGRLVYLDTQAGTVVGAAPFTLGPVLSLALDTSRTTAYFTTTKPGGRELIAIDLRSRSIEWRLPLADVADAVSYDGVQLSGQEIALFADNRTLAMGGSLRNQILGIAAFNPISRTVDEFRELSDPLGFVALPPSGALAASILTGRRADGRVGINILVLAPNSLQTLDSIAPAPPYEDPGRFVAPPAGDNLYITNYTSIYSYSRQQRRVLASAEIPVFAGQLAISPDGESIVLGDEGFGIDGPGSGKLFVYDQSLNLQKTIDLSPASTNGIHVVTRRLAFSRDGRWLFAAAGTASTGPLFGVQPAQVLVIDARTFEFVKAIPLNDYGSVIFFPWR